MAEESIEKPGVLIAIGGAEEKSGEMEVLKRVLAEAKGNQSRVHVITTAGGLPEEYKKMYVDAFRLLGVECIVTHISTRDEANDPKIVNSIADADVIFFSGGNQLRLTTILGDTLFLDKVVQRHNEGAVVAGTSAGAAAASALMICGGRGENVLLTAGLGFVEGVIFDTHFSKRRRLSRLFNAVATKDRANLGVGIDDDTGVVVDDGVMEVIGSGVVTVVDKRRKPKKLSSGMRYNIRERKIIP